MTQKHRGYGTMIVVSFGVLGAVAANVVALNGHALSGILQRLTGWVLEGWQVAYIIGGILGIFLLLLRIGVYESHMYSSLQTSNVSKGNFFKLFSSRPLFIKYLCCIAIGVPIWYMIGVLIALARDISTIKGIGNVVTGNAVMYFYIGTSFGDFMSGYISQIFKSRIRIVFLYLCITVIAVPFYLYLPFKDPVFFYWICAFLGLASGYWAVFITIASEQFGTNIRSTVTTSVPNFVRGSLVLLTLTLNLFRKNLEIDLITSCLIVGIIAVGIAFLALNKLEETYHKELGYVELM
jgi:putative MFS transporter